MRERPILFSAPMVRAILAGTKTQTRRIVKPQPAYGGVADVPELGEGWIWSPRGTKRERYNNPCGEHDLANAMACSPFAYAYKGDRLWVRETWQPIWRDGVEFPPGYDEPEKWAISYPATDGIREYSHPDRGLTSACKPGIHMPRFASRITLKVAGVRVERLHDISEADAKAEGATPYIYGHGFITELGIAADPGIRTPSMYRAGFEQLWREINGAESWDANPLVWVVAFTKATP
jgi:hypothetical protein